MNTQDIHDLFLCKFMEVDYTTSIGNLCPLEESGGSTNHRGEIFINVSDLATVYGHK